MMHPVLAVGFLFVLGVSLAPKEAPVPIPDICTGCAGTAVNDPITGMVNGVQVLILDYSLVGAWDATFVVESGQCQSNYSGGPCWPTRNCVFKAWYSVSTNTNETGALHDDQTPCNWSSPAGDEEYLYGQWEWYGACQGGTYPWTFSVAYGSDDCRYGIVIFQVQFSGACATCPTGPL